MCRPARTLLLCEVSSARREERGASGTKPELLKNRRFFNRHEKAPADEPAGAFSCILVGFAEAFQVPLLPPALLSSARTLSSPISCSAINTSRW